MRPLLKTNALVSIGSKVAHLSFFKKHNTYAYAHKHTQPYEYTHVTLSL
jgi:hypothetical protein